MNERPKDIVEAMEYAKSRLEVGYSFGQAATWLEKDQAWPNMLAAAIKELKELREQYAIQNDSYSRLRQQLYG